MDVNDYIVKDSSIWQDQESFALENKSDATLKIGVVRDTVVTKGDEISYIVEVWLGGKNTPIQCARTSRFGGVYNYEEFTYRGFAPDDTPGSDGLIDFKQGDLVLIAYIFGDSREGIIVGGINHPGRARKFDEASGIVYESEFNGINKSITKDGEYKTTFKGLQTNIDKLDMPANGDPIPAPEYDEAIGSTYTLFDKTGSYTISDNSNEDPQSIFIDKPNGQIVITSGKTSLVIDKVAESYTITNKTTSINSADSWNLTTKATTITSEEVNVEASDIKTKGEWSQDGDTEIKGDVTIDGDTEISGSLSADGEVKLAGGANPLVYDIVLTMGTGNLGLPVISNNILLKTIMTKAT